MKRDVRSRLCFTYRTNLAPIGLSQLTTDAGYTLDLQLLLAFLITLTLEPKPINPKPDNLNLKRIGLS